MKTLQNLWQEHIMTHQRKVKRGKILKLWLTLAPVCGGEAQSTFPPQNQSFMLLLSFWSPCFAMKDWWSFSLEESLETQQLDSCHYCHELQILNLSFHFHSHSDGDPLVNLHSLFVEELHSNATYTAGMCWTINRTQVLECTFSIRCSH